MTLSEVEHCPHCLRQYVPSAPHTTREGECKSDAQLRDEGWIQMPNRVWVKEFLTVEEFAAKVAR